MSKPRNYLSNDAGQSFSTERISRDLITTKNSPFNQKTLNQSIKNADLPSSIDQNTNINWLGSSFSGADIKVVAHLYNTAVNDPKSIRESDFASDEDYIETYINSRDSYKGPATIELGTLQTLSMQVYRESVPVRALGRSYARGFTQGPRTIAGSMIFTIFEEHPLAKLMRAMSANDMFGMDKEDIVALLPDQLPPIDLTISFANEYGAISSQRIYGVKFVADGQTYSIEDLLSENVMQFIALDCDLLKSHGNLLIDRNARFADRREQPLAGSTLFDDKYYQEYLDKIFTRRKLRNR